MEGIIRNDAYWDEMARARRRGSPWLPCWRPAAPAVLAPARGTGFQGGRPLRQQLDWHRRAWPRPRRWSPSSSPPRAATRCRPRPSPACLAQGQDRLLHAAHPVHPRLRRHRGDHEGRARQGGHEPAGLQRPGPAERDRVLRAAGDGRGRGRHHHRRDSLWHGAERARRGQGQGHPDRHRRPVPAVGQHEHRCGDLRARRGRPAEPDRLVDHRQLARQGQRHPRRRSPTRHPRSPTCRTRCRSTSSTARAARSR